MRRILCTGDSHTWGEGAGGYLNSFNPPLRGGELRLMDFTPGNYVNRLRRLVEAHTSSASREWLAEELATLIGNPFAPPCATLTGDKALTLTFTGAFLRVEYARTEAPGTLTVEIDGTVIDTRQEPAGTGDVSDFRLAHYHLEDGDHTLTLRAAEGTVGVYRLEAYTGSAAVINSGVGSCPTFRYLDDYFDNYVAAIRPDVVLAEAHTINDWLALEPPAVYAQRLTRLVEAYKGLGAKVILLTVAPIIGKRENARDIPYNAYVEASRRVAADTDVVLCDANRLMEAGALGMTDEELFAWLLNDCWHPNDRGHAMYAELAFQTIQREGLLDNE